MTVLQFPVPEDTPANVLIKAATEIQPTDAVFVIIRRGAETHILSSRFDSPDISMAATMMQAYAVQHMLSKP